MKFTTNEKKEDDSVNFDDDDDDFWDILDKKKEEKGESKCESAAKREESNLKTAFEFAKIESPIVKKSTNKEEEFDKVLEAAIDKNFKYETSDDNDLSSDEVDNFLASLLETGKPKKTKSGKFKNNDIFIYVSRLRLCVGSAVIKLILKILKSQLHPFLIVCKIMIAKLIEMARLVRSK